MCFVVTEINQSINVSISSAEWAFKLQITLSRKLADTIRQVADPVTQ